MNEVYIHLGLHKTATTFLQKYFFKIYSKECGYIDIRKKTPLFLEYILHSNDLDFDYTKAQELFKNEAYRDKNSSKIITLSDEQFCGSPWNNAKDRKRYLDRLNSVFSDAKYIIVFRRQEDIVHSLYLQYIKSGGTTTFTQFLTYKRTPLEFSLKSYLNYGKYLQYIVTTTSTDRVKCLLYEEMKDNPQIFLSSLAAYLGFNIDERIVNSLNIRANKSLPIYAVNFVRFINKFSSSFIHPFLLFPTRLRTYTLKTLISILPPSKNTLRNLNDLQQFCRDPKKDNYIISNIIKKDIKRIGY